MGTQWVRLIKSFLRSLSCLDTQDYEERITFLVLDLDVVDETHLIFKSHVDQGVSSPLRFHVD